MSDTKNTGNLADVDSVVAAYSHARAILRVRLETLATTKVELYFNETYITSATGFIYRYAKTYAMVTNWHVLTGINPNTGANIDPNGARPNRIKFYLNIFTDIFGQFEVKPYAADLIIDGQPIWYQLPHGKMPIDIALIELEAIIDDFAQIRERIGHLQGGQMLVHVDEQNIPKFAFHAYPRIGAEVFILGFPKGIGQGSFPIWKRGSIATEPLHNVTTGGAKTGAPVILVDAITRDGMSGSPVLYFGSEVMGEFGPSTADTGMSRVVGVYAGREGVTAEENSMSLGRVWKVEVLDALFSAKRCLGRYDFDPPESDAL
jgi:hypothetical protein